MSEQPVPQATETEEKLPLEGESSASVKFYLAGFDSMFTLRDWSAQRLMKRLQGLVQALQKAGATPASAPAPAARPAPAQAAPAAAPAPVAAPVAAAGKTSTVDVVDLDTFYVTEVDGKRRGKLKCGGWKKHGVTMWPEVALSIGVDLASCQFQTNYSLPKHVAVAVVLLNETGNPMKVVKFRDREGNDIMPVHPVEGAAPVPEDSQIPPDDPFLF